MGYLNSNNKIIMKELHLSEKKLTNPVTSYFF